MPIQWVPTEVLQFDPNYSGFTCMGFAPSKGRRCRNPIACANRQEAAKILLEMSRLHPQSQRVDNLLEELASRLLCRRWHQNQAAGIMRQWQDDIDNYQAAEEDRIFERVLERLKLRLAAEAVRAERSIVVRTSPGPARSTVARTRATSHGTDRNISSVAPLRILGSSSITPLVATREEPRVTNYTEASEEVSEQQTDPEPDSPSQQRALVRETDYQETSPSSRSSVDELSTHTPDASLRGPIVATREEVTDEGEPEEQAIEAHAEEESPHTHDRRAVEGDCSICFEDLIGGDEVSWCKAQCKHNFHADCVNTWHASRVADRCVKICPYCRTEWAD